MDEQTFVVRFSDGRARDAFVSALREDTKLASLEVEIGEFFPDLVIRSVSPADLSKLKALAPGARFIADFGHGLMAARV